MANAGASTLNLNGPNNYPQGSMFPQPSSSEDAWKDYKGQQYNNDVNAVGQYPKTARNGPNAQMSPYQQGSSKYEDAPLTSKEHKGIFDQNANWEGRFHPEDVREFNENEAKKKILAEEL